MSERFNVLMCKFYKFYICAVVGVIIEKLVNMLFFNYGSRNRWSDGLETRLRTAQPGSLGSITGKSRIFCLLHSTQTGSESQTASF